MSGTPDETLGAATEVHVAIDPLGADAPDDALIEAVTAALEPYRRIGHDVVAGPAALVPLVVEVTICVAGDRVRETIVAAVTKSLLALFAPDAVSFGEPVRASRLVAAAAAVPGVTSAETPPLAAPPRQVHLMKVVALDGDDLFGVAAGAERQCRRGRLGNLDSGP